MKHIWLITLFLAGCKGNPPRLCEAEHRTLGEPWSAIRLPASGGTVCAGTDSKEKYYNSIVIQHRRAEGFDVADLRDQYVAAFRKAGWTTVQVVDDAPIMFSADLQWPDGSHALAVSIARKDEIITFDAHRAGPGWPPRERAPGS